MAQGEGRTYKCMENLPILKDFVLYWGRSPASPMKTKEKLEQGKGTADHLMPLGYLFTVAGVILHDFGRFGVVV